MSKKENIDWKALDHAAVDMILTSRIRDYWEHVQANGGKEAKRIGCVIERIADIGNLREADRRAQDGKVAKNRFIRRHNLRAEEELRALQMMILTLDFPPCQYNFMDVVSDAGKVRHIAKQKYYPWRILHHAIMQVIGPYIYRSLIHDTFACIKGKGLHYGVKRMKMMLRRYPEYRWFWKTDYKKFYPSIPHDVIRAALGRKFKDERLVKMLDIAVLSYDSGDEIKEALNEEMRHKKRCADRRIHQPAAGKFRRERRRPLCEGMPPGEMLPEVLRRCGGHGSHESPGAKGYGSFRQDVILAGAGSESLGRCGTNRTRAAQ